MKPAQLKLVPDVVLPRAMQWMVQWPKQAAALLQTMRDAVPLPNEILNPPAAREQLVLLSAAMAREGRSLVQRVLPSPPDIYRQWTHYPEGDAIDPASTARWFYHAHKPEGRKHPVLAREHGHFHIFLPLSAFADEQAVAAPEKPKAAKVVHVAALSFDTDGLPTHWLATNQWVTEEYLYPAEAVIARLDRVTLDQAGTAQGIDDVGQWLTLALQMCREDIVSLLQERDQMLEQSGPRDRSAEVLALRPFAI